MIFDTDRLRVRKLTFSDIDDFHQMQSNLKVMQYATGKVKSFEEDKKELSKLINKYTELSNDFWILL